MSKRNPDIGFDDIESEFDFGSDAERNRKKSRKDDLYAKEQPGLSKLPSRSQAKNSFDDEHSRFERQKRRLMTLDVYSRHKELINHYFLYHPGATKRLQRDTSKDRNDYDVLRENHKFLWDEKELSEAAKTSWEARLAKKYYDKLFKEYCIADLSQYKHNRIAMRWRTENEVRLGKGQFECGSKRCDSRENLISWEVNFGYIENGTKKNALVKLRLCPDCSVKLNFRSKKKKARSNKKLEGMSASSDRTKESSSDIGSKEAIGYQKGSPSTSAEGINTANDSKLDEDVTSEVKEKELKLKEEAEKMAQIWKKSQEPLNPEQVAEAELDDFLEDMFM